MFRLINEDHKKIIDQYLETLGEISATEAAEGLSVIIEGIRSDIPEKKRISYGRYSIIRDTGLYLRPLLEENGFDVIGTGRMLYGILSADPFIRSLGIQLVAVEAVHSDQPEAALGDLEKSAADDDWIVRECSSGFVRKLVKKYPSFMHDWYLKMVKDINPLKRRYASESLRPVVENAWFRNDPEYAFSIIRHLFHESEAYPRTSAGNSLSDWMRIKPDFTLPVVKELAASGDKNSYWIACRACRNLVKKDPLLVMDILKTDHYKYKDRDFQRADFQ